MVVARRAAQQRVLYSIIVLLTGYVAVDFLANHTNSFPALQHFCACSSSSKMSAAIAKGEAELIAGGQEQEEEYEEPAICRTLQGHLDVNISRNPLSSLSSSSAAAAAVGGDGDHTRVQQDPWKQMKWVGPPATCRVKGLLIEKLDPALNFRRGVSLKYVADVEDKTHLLPWLLATRVNLHSRERRVFIDLGANTFSTSLSWFMHLYPLDFTEVHAFEVDETLLKKPKKGFEEAGNHAAANDRSVMVKQTPGIPQWMLDRVTLHYQYVSDFDDEENRAVNITRFLKDELKLRPSDAVVVKMDIEGSEWPILDRWMQDAEMASIVDELFVEVHYDHPSMRGYHWARFAPTKRDDALSLLAQLRLHGFFAHAWP